MKTMNLKTFVLSLIIGLLINIQFTHAQSQENFSYQAVIRDANNEVVTNQAVGLKITIIQGSPTSGREIYTETYNPNPTTNDNGLLTVEIGNGESLAGADFTEIDWSEGPYFLKTETDPTGGSDYSITGTSQLLSVPYALHAKTAEEISGGITETDPSVTKYEVGDFAQGGVVFWVDETGQHGLVAAKENQNDGNRIKWYNENSIATEAHSEGIYAGEMNTMLIIANQGSPSDEYAAGVCANYAVTENGVTYSDWYLPSKEELDLMYQNKAVINSVSESNGGSDFVDWLYWSSTEDDDFFVWIQNFNDGTQEIDEKGYTVRVRAVRAFQSNIKKLV